MNTIESGRERANEQQADAKNRTRAQLASALSQATATRPTVAIAAAGQEPHQPEQQKKPDGPIIPESVTKRHRQVGTEFYSRERDGALAFRDEGKRLSTERNDLVTVTSMVELAQAKGWQTMSVSGDTTFKREVWRQAIEQGITVKGYDLTPNDTMLLVEVERRRAEEANARARAQNTSGAINQAVQRAQAQGQGQNLNASDPRAAAAALVNTITEQKGYAPSERARIQAAVQSKIDRAAERGEIAGLAPAPKTKRPPKVKVVTPDMPTAQPVKQTRLEAQMAANVGTQKVMAKNDNLQKQAGTQQPRAMTPPAQPKMPTPTPPPQGRAARAPRERA